VFKLNSHFGKFGGAYVPEMLIPALIELEEAFIKCKKSNKFKKELQDLYTNYSGRPTPLYFAENLTKKLGGAKIFIKNEGLNHTGAHKINHCLGQILMAKFMKKKRIIAETGAGQHGLATATVAAKFGLKCTVYMGETDVLRQYPNVFWMKQLGAEVRVVKEGSRTLKDAVNAAIKDWISNSEDSYYLLGSALGPHPYPTIVKYFQEIVGKEAKKQLKQYGVDKPDYVVACVGGGSNAIGIFSPFIKDKNIKLIGVEAGGNGVKGNEHAARFQKGGKVGVIEGYKSYFLQDDEGQVEKTHSIAAGLDYPGIGPEHSDLFEKGRVKYEYITDKEAVSALQTLTQTEGIIPALESSHAVAYAIKLAKKLSKNKTILVNLSGRGDKDIFILAEYLKDSEFREYLQRKSK